MFFAIRENIYINDKDTCHKILKLTITLLIEVNFLCYSSAEKQTDGFSNPDILFKAEKKKGKVKEGIPA